MQLVIGIDGGASTTRAVIADGAGNVLGRGNAPGSNYHTLGVEAARQHISMAVDSAWAAAGQPAEPAVAAFLGMAGILTPAERQMIAGIAADLSLASRDAIAVDHDLRIAWAGGLGGRPGIVVIAGTGSSCYGRTVTGESWKAGGWDWLFDNQGGAYRVALAGVEAAVREYDGRGESTALTCALMAALGVAKLEQLVDRLRPNRIEKAELAALAPVVLAEAEHGDAVAAEIARHQADELAVAVEAVSRRLGLFGRPHEVTYTGSLLVKNDFYRGLFNGAVQRRVASARVVVPRLDAVLGAVVLALQTGGLPVTETVIERLAGLAENR